MSPLDVMPLDVMPRAHRSELFVTTSASTALVEARDLAWRGPLPSYVLENVDLALGHELVGVVGKNGAGKSTLLKLLAGELSPERGHVVRRGPLAFLRQDAFSRTTGTVAEGLGVADVLGALHRLLAGAGSPADAALVEGRWDLPERVDEALRSVGLAGLDSERPLASLSGGERARAAIATALLEAPAALLLDEPTNHLDEHAREAVADTLRSLKAGALVVTHDRRLLDRVDRILEVTGGGLRTFGGAFEAFREAREHERELAEERLDEVTREARKARRELARAVEAKAKRDARGKRERAKGGQAKALLDLQKERSERSTGRLGRLQVRVLKEAADKVREARTHVERSAPLAFDVEATRVPASTLVLSVEGVSVQEPSAPRPLLDDVTLYARGPERLAITGPNGAGKSTLLALLAGTRASTSGEVRVGVGEIAFVDQEAGGLLPHDTLVSALARAWPSSTEGQRRERLAAFLFPRERAFQLVSTLSGGERVRAALACALSRERPPQLLLLDEPTNHLDLPSLEALAAILRSFAGALVLVSHDRTFREEVGITREVRLERGRVVDVLASAEGPFCPRDAEGGCGALG